MQYPDVIDPGKNIRFFHSYARTENVIREETIFNRTVSTHRDNGPATKKYKNKFRISIGRGDEK
jgi:hypothetical protein